MWRPTQISRVPAILARRASATLISTVFAIALAVAAADPLPNGYDAPLSTPLVVPTTPVPTAVPATPTRPTSAPEIQVPSSASVPTTISPGRTTSSFSVSNSGVATYAIPLWTPPGVGSDQLKLALSYSSQSFDGVIGVGWNLSGTSSITRCNRTWAQDGFAQGITLTTADRLCLDGQQLKVVSGSPTAPAQGGTTFATEIESFSRIVAAGSSGSAPISLTVTTKNGLIYDYGLTVDSQIMGGPNSPIRAWALSQIRDRVGNTIKFSYYNDAQSGTGYTNGSYRIKEIDYPYTASGQGPFYSVTFSYGARPAGTNVPSGYIAGGIVQEPNQLNSISIQNYGSSTPTKAYYLTYATNSVSSRLELQQVQECSATKCYPATKVGYQTGSQGWSGSPIPTGVSSASGTGPVPGSSAGPIAVDLNGDGLTDILYPVDAGSGYVHWWVIFANGGGTPVDTHITTINNTFLAPPILGTFSGTRQTQVLLLPSSPSNSPWYVLTCDTSGCSSASAGVSYNSEVYAADWDGDGLPDLVSQVGNSVVIRRNITTPRGPVTFASTATTVWTVTGPSPYSFLNLPGGGIRVADFNADGRQDLLVETVQNIHQGNIFYWNALISNGFGAPATQVVIEQSFVEPTPPLLADWNGDGCTDILSNAVFISNCAGGFNAVPWPSGVGGAGLAVDWDGDGRTDLLYNNNNAWYVARSTGNGVAPGVPTGLAAPPGTSWFIIDPNGDGLADLAYVDSTKGNAISYVVHAGSGTPADLATSFTDGFGMNQSPTYVPIAENNYYQYFDATFPEVDYTGPQYVVNQFTASDGTGSTYQNQFWYFGARVHAQGRGFEGFYARRTYDTRNGLYTYDYQGRTFPYTFMPFQRYVLQGDLTTYIQKWTGTLSNQISGGSGYEQRLFPFLSPTVQNDYEYGGALNGTVTKTTSTTYSYGDGFGNLTQAATSITDKDSSSPYFNLTWQSVVNNTYLNDNTSVWCLGLPTVTTVQNSAPSQTTRTRTYNYTPDTNHALCREQHQIIEPSTAALTVTTDLLFDACGNINSITVTGHNPDGSQMSPRPTTVDYGTRCQLPELVTNALSQKTKFGYRYDFGLVNLVTDPNNLPASRAYDDFGRISQVTRADNTYSIYTPYYCNTPPCWGTPDLRFSVYRDDHGTDGTLAYSEGLYWDGLGRQRYDTTTHAFGRLVYDEIVLFDSLGRRIDQYQPVASGSNGYIGFAYDPLNRLTAAQLIKPDKTVDRTVTIGYGGRTVQMTDPLSHTETYISDVMGQLRQVKDPPSGATTLYEYDVFGNPNKITDAIGAVSTATYNLRGFKTQMIDADAGTWVFNGDSLNELVSWTDAKTQSFGAAYDGLGRMTSRTESEGTSTWTWDGMPSGCPSGGKYVGQLARESGYGYTEARCYDAISRLQTRVITTNQDYQYDYSYNSIGAVDTVTYPTSPAPPGTTATRFKIRYGYSYSYPTQISDITQPTAATLWTLTAANDYASPTAETLGSSVVSVSSGYTAWTDDLTSIQSGVSGSTTNRQNLAYAWDLAGNLHQRQDLNQSNLTEIFFYDALNRLTSSTLNGVQNFSASYVNGSGVEQAGNIMNRLDVGSYTYGDASHPHGVTAAGPYTFTYDRNGNTATRNGLSIQWASFNLPTSLQASIGGTTYSSSFSYGPDHQRYYQAATYSNGTENTSYAGGLFEVVAGTDTQGNTFYKNYVPTPSGLTIIVSRNLNGTTPFSTTAYALSDHLGSSDALVDGTAGNVGNLLVHESFAPFGQRRGSNWTGAPSAPDWAAIAKTTRRGFTFHEMLDNIGLVHMNGRVYDPNVGRFLSVDSFIGDLSDSQSVNPYAYVGNRPLSVVDPSGEDAGLPEVLVQAAADTGGPTNPVGVVLTAIDIVYNILDIFGLFGSAPPPPPPATTLPNSSGQLQFRLPDDWTNPRPPPTWGTGPPTIPGVPGPILSFGPPDTNVVEGFNPDDSFGIAARLANDLRNINADAKQLLQTKNALDFAKAPHAQGPSNYRRAILGDFGLKFLEYMPFYDVANCVYGGKCKLGDWATATLDAGVGAIGPEGTLAKDAVEIAIKKIAVKTGAKSVAQMTKHLEKLNATRTRLKELERRLETLKGPKARGPVSDEIRDLSDQIKGHEKEIRQKWPELGDNF